MKKRLLILSVVIVLIVSSMALVACNKNADMDIYPAWVYNNSLYTENAEMTEGSNLRIMSYNILVEAWNTNPLRNTSMKQGYKARVEQAAKMFNYYLPDVVGLQETCEKWHQNLPKEISDNYTFVKDFNGMFNFTSMIYNHNKVDLVESGKLKYSKRSESTMRYAAWAIFSRKSDSKKFVVINTHFDFGKEPEKMEMRKTQMKEFAELGKKLHEEHNAPVFLVGDYNFYDKEITDKESPLFDWNQGVELYEQFKEDNKATFTDANYIPGINTIDGKHVKWDDPKWDHIFVTSDVAVKTYAVLSNDYYTSISDHSPIFVDVAI